MKSQRVGGCSHGQKRGCMGRSMKNSLERHVRALSWKIFNARLGSVSFSPGVPLNVLEPERGPEEV